SFHYSEASSEIAVNTNSIFLLCG
ncbi:purine-nucleoside phosphorylase, partial [Streptococcus sp. SPC0]|nr:purine-nucleoside phosphorylase [Streptococcus sp. SPC0]